MEDGFLNEIASIVNEKVTEFEKDEMAYNCMELCGTTNTVTSDEYINELVLKRKTLCGDVGVYREKEFFFNDLHIKYDEKNNGFIAKPLDGILRNKLERRFDYDKLKEYEYFNKYLDFCTHWKDKVLFKVKVDDDTYKYGGYPVKWMTYSEFCKLYESLLECGTNITGVSKYYWGVKYEEENENYPYKSIVIGNILISIYDIDISKATSD